MWGYIHLLSEASREWTSGTIPIGVDTALVGPPNGDGRSSGKIPRGMETHMVRLWWHPHKDLYTAGRIPIGSRLGDGHISGRIPIGMDTHLVGPP